MLSMRITLFLMATFLSSIASAESYVEKHNRKSGAHVQGYKRSDANQYRFDNYSSRGNTNPRTGKIGSHRNEFDNDDLRAMQKRANRGNRD